MGKTPKIGCIVSTLSFMAFLTVVYYEFLSHHSVDAKLGFVKGGLLAGMFLFLGLIASDFTWRITSDYYSFRNLWIHYLSLILLRVMSYYMYKSLIRQTRKGKETQEKLILSWIAANATTVYGKQHKFSQISSVDEFRAQHPLTKYQHYEEYVNDIYNGKSNVMSPVQPYILAMTSGTSGNPKMLPTFPKGSSIFFFQGILPIFHIMFTHIDGMSNFQKKLKFFYTPRWRKSPSGIPIGPNSSSPSNSRTELSFHSTPAAAFDILSEPEALYVYLLFGLRDKKLGCLEANFSSLIYTAFVNLESKWKHLVNDIRNGYINEDLNIDSNVRDRLNSQLIADPQRADELEEEFERGFLGIAKKIWPYMNFILCVDSGAFHVYGELLTKGYCKGLQIYSPIYAATEGFIGVNLWPFSQQRHYMLVPQALFYEFIPIEESNDCEQPRTLLMHQVEEGKVYEMVISNCSGLYRYRFGDVVKVVGFNNQTPLVEFMYRQGQLLNVRGEKTSEKVFYDSFYSSFKAVFPDSLLVDYCCAELLPQSDTAPGYLIFIEIGGDTPSQDVVSQMEKELDDSLMQSYIYKSFRVKGSIAPVKVSLVASGTFFEFRLNLIDSDKATPNQFKVPRVILFAGLIGQPIEDFRHIAEDDEIRHWQRYSGSDNVLYVVNFNYLLNGLQIDRVEVVVPDPLIVLNQQIPDLYFSLVFWRSSKLFEDLQDVKDVLLTLSYKLTVRPGKGEFLWNEMTGKLLIPCSRLGCPKIASTSESYYYLGWIIYSSVTAHEPISFAVKSHQSATSLVYEEARAYDIDEETSRTFDLAVSQRKLRLVSIYYSVIDEELTVKSTLVPATFSIEFNIKYAETRCHYKGKRPLPFLITFLLLEEEHDDEHHRHYLTLSPSTYYNLYQTMQERAGDEVSIVLSKEQYGVLFELAERMDATISTMFLRIMCTSKDDGSVVLPTPIFSKDTCSSNKLTCFNDGRCTDNSCLCHNSYMGPQCTVFQRCDPNPCGYDWQECTKSTALRPKIKLQHECTLNPYHPTLAENCMDDVDCENLLFSRCANGSCVCNPGYTRNSTIVQGVRQELCMKAHALCDRDTQCHYINTDMICTRVGEGSKKCYCSEIALRDAENGLCRHSLVGLARGFEWKPAYTIGVIVGAVCVFLMCVALVVVDHRQSNKNTAQKDVIKRTFDHVIELERELSALEQHKPVKKEPRRSKHDQRRASDLGEGYTRRRYSTSDLDDPIVERYRLTKSGKSNGYKIRSKVIQLQALQKINKDKSYLAPGIRPMTYENNVQERIRSDDRGSSTVIYGNTPDSQGSLAIEGPVPSARRSFRQHRSRSRKKYMTGL